MTKKSDREASRRMWLEDGRAWLDSAATFERWVKCANTMAAACFDHARKISRSKTQGDVQ
jgi:hypothetical protein